MPARRPSLVLALGLLAGACFSDTPPNFGDTDTTGEPTNTSESVTTSGGGLCGDDVVQGDEECDKGPAGNGACTDRCTLNVCGDGYVGQGESCDESSPACVACKLVSCGDGQVDPGEGCDDGNDDDGDACPSTCVPATCGDSLVWAQVEECDDGNAEDQDACLATCVAATCGDSLVWTGVEGCDDGNNVNDDGCSNNCAVPGCGDTVLQPGEVCDDGNVANDDGCSATCQAESCGDGIKQANEECDDGNSLDSDACLLGCKANVCGDGILNLLAEQCDHGALNHDDPGRAACSATCTRSAYLVFVTSQRFVPKTDFDSAQSADDRCASAAADGFSGGIKGTTWMAWLSDQDTSPSERFFESELPYVHIHGQTATPIATDWSDLSDGDLLAPLQVDELDVLRDVGDDCDDMNLVWTATSTSGQALNNPCLNWKTNSLNYSAVVGSLLKFDGQWTNDNCGLKSRCNVAARFYCFEQPPP